ncbi:phytanoyl-CoA dioxygenase family protein [Chryseobacterium sp. RLHN22]|uniref:phytanoyl-CoA dioxygenase family protein n=1 Tax=Chryseobacterium sp. RLHN22 TaxID=3437885 RepID=UPI003D9B068B
MKNNISQYYNDFGYIHSENFFSDKELQQIEVILKKFHENWLKANEKDYQSGLINSHSLTSSKFISHEERLEIFKFIAQDKISKIIQTIIPGKAIFLNTQLFFDPFNKNQNNYWHRDIQYTGMSIDEQKEKIKTQNVLHFRIPLQSELGIELIPTTHKNWDLKEEEETRLSMNGRKPSDNLQRGKIISLDRGDLLIFSANMIHRGLYGNNRFTFDIIFCDDTPEFRTFIDFKNHPTQKELKSLSTRFF